MSDGQNNIYKKSVELPSRLIALTDGISQGIFQSAEEANQLSQAIGLQIDAVAASLDSRLLGIINSLAKSSTEAKQFYQATGTQIDAVAASLDSLHKQTEKNGK